MSSSLLYQTCMWLSQLHVLSYNSLLLPNKPESESRSVVSNSLRPHGLYSPWNSPGRNIGVGSLSLLQGIFPTQGSNPGIPHCRWILYQLSHKGSPRVLSVQFSSVTQLCPTLWPHELQHARPHCQFSNAVCLREFSLPTIFVNPLHVCLLSRFSCVQLCASLWMVAHQAPLSMGFSRQEYWNGLPFPSP